jgi:hypothetical protein
MTVERPIRVATAIERPLRVRRVSIKVAENQDIEATQAQLAAKAVIDAFQPVVQALTEQLTWKPNLAAVRAAVQYTIATGRLAVDVL